MKEFSVTVEVRNNRLKERRTALGLNQSQLCKAAGVSATEYGRLEKMKNSPVGKEGAWRSTAVRLAKFFGVKPDDLFPPAVLEAKETRQEIKADGEELLRLSGSLNSHALEGYGADPEQLYGAVEMKEVLDDLCRTLPPRAEQMVRMHFGVDGEAMTAEQIGDAFGISRSRAAQVIQRACSTLRVRAKRTAIGELTAIEDFAVESR